MRLREVKKGMKVIIYRAISSEKYFVGKKGKIISVIDFFPTYNVETALKGRGISLWFSHKELKEIK